MATSPVDLGDYKTRIVALYKEALDSVSVALDGKSYSFYVSESPPYVTLRTGAITVEGDGEELDTYTVQIEARLKLGYITSGVSGELDEKLDDWLMLLIHYFNQRELLQSVAHPTPPLDLDYARIVACGGEQVESTGGSTPTQMKVVVFTHELHILNQIEQVYL